MAGARKRKRSKRPRGQTNSPENRAVPSPSEPQAPQAHQEIRRAFLRPRSASVPRTVSAAAAAGMNELSPEPDESQSRTPSETRSSKVRSKVNKIRTPTPTQRTATEQETNPRLMAATPKAPSSGGPPSAGPTRRVVIGLAPTSQQQPHRGPTRAPSSLRGSDTHVQADDRQLERPPCYHCGERTHFGNRCPRPHDYASQRAYEIRNKIIDIDHRCYHCGSFDHTTKLHPGPRIYGWDIARRMERDAVRHSDVDFGPGGHRRGPQPTHNPRRSDSLNRRRSQSAPRGSQATPSSSSSSSSGAPPQMSSHRQTLLSQLGATMSDMELRRLVDSRLKQHPPHGQQ